MPLVHVTAVGYARDVVNSGQIEARYCGVFDKKLTYFFLLRPAYRLKNGDIKSDQINRFPFVFIVSPENLQAPFHVYSLDTGAAADGWFHEKSDSHVELEDYELEQTLAAAAQHIEWAFGSAGAYFDGDLRPDIGKALNDWDDVAKSYVSIAGLAATGSNQPDKRASAVEIAYQRHVPLKGFVEFAVIPKQYLENGTAKNAEFIAKLKDAGIEWDTYDWQPNMVPDECHEQITRVVRKYFEKKKIL